jgi:hypothetical protein
LNVEPPNYPLQVVRPSPITCGVFVRMLVIYKTRVLTVTPPFTATFHVVQFENPTAAGAVGYRGWGRESLAETRLPRGTSPRCRDRPPPDDRQIDAVRQSVGDILPASGPLLPHNYTATQFVGPGEPGGPGRVDDLARTAGRSPQSFR